MRRGLLSVLLLLAIAGCDQRAPDSVENDPHSYSPLLREYTLAIMKSWYYQQRATSWMTIADQPRGSQRLHIQSETVCPTRYHVRMTGPIDLERYIVDGQRYERKGSGTWTTAPMTQPASELSPCATARRPATERVPDEADAESVMPNFSDAKVTKGPIREYEGVKCQEYSLNGANFGSLVRCFAVDGDPYPIYTAFRKATTITVKWNQPLKIEPPKM